MLPSTTGSRQGVMGEEAVAELLSTDGSLLIANGRANDEEEEHPSLS